MWISALFVSLALYQPRPHPAAARPVRHLTNFSFTINRIPDYAVDIYHHALDHPGKPYSCYLRDDSALPMMILSDCIEVRYDPLPCSRRDLFLRV